MLLYVLAFEGNRWCFSYFYLIILLYQVIFYFSFSLSVGSDTNFILIIFFHICIWRYRCHTCLHTLLPRGKKCKRSSRDYKIQVLFICWKMRWRFIRWCPVGNWYVRSEDMQRTTNIHFPLNEGKAALILLQKILIWILRPTPKKNRDWISSIWGVFL